MICYLWKNHCSKVLWKLIKLQRLFLLCWYDAKKEEVMKVKGRHNKKWKDLKGASSMTNLFSAISHNKGPSTWTWTKSSFYDEL